MSTDHPKLEVDGEHHIFQDKLLEELVGNWNVTGRIAGQQFEQYCDTDWVLNHQFLRVHFIDSAARNRGSIGTPSNAEYEAIVFIGRDNMSERYVAHWIDIFGGRFSETLRYGTRLGDSSIMFLFEYPDGLLHNTFTWNLMDGTQTSKIVQKNSLGEWTEFLSELFKKT